MTLFYVPAIQDGFRINLTDMTFTKEPPGNTKTVQEVLDFERDNQPGPTLVQQPHEVISKSITAPVTIPNDALPSNLDELQVLLESDRAYTFRFRVTRYSSDVSLDLGFVVPGDTDAATISWNDVRLDGVFLGDDDELELSTVGTDVIGVEVSGIITVNSEGGLFIPQIRQDTADSQTSTVAEAYVEVTQNGN